MKYFDPKFVISIIILLLSISLPEVLISQPRIFLRDFDIKYSENVIMVDSSVDKLISYMDDSLIIDSIKVDILMFFKEIRCKKCLYYLVDHITDRFSYGSGISESDQFKAEAPLNILSSIAYQKDDKCNWSLIDIILEVLKNKPKTEWEIQKINRIFCYISNRQVGKTILVFEMNEAKSQMGRFKNPVYESNLTLMLKQFD